MEGLKACSPDRELCCLDGETGPRTCTKKPFWYCGCSSVPLGLNWRKSHWHIQESQPNAEKLSLKSCRLLLRLTWIFSQVVGVFHVVYCDDKKKKCGSESHERRLRRYANHIAFLLLSLTEIMQLPINISTSYMAKKHKKPQWIHQLYIFSNFRYIYLITENNCSKEGTDC